MPLPAGGTGVISGSDLEAREDKHMAFGDKRHRVSDQGPREVDLRDHLPSTEVHEVVKLGKSSGSAMAPPESPQIMGERGRVSAGLPTVGSRSHATCQ